MKRVEQLLRREIGLDPASVGPALIEHSVRRRMKELGLAKIAAYLRLLHSSRDEWKQLVESVVITETWFFRDDAPFSAFVRMAQTEWLPGHPGEVLRVFSIACASGEEPYSLAMALLDTGWEEDRFRIEATDISERALQKAERGLYGRNSFRGADLSFRERHFRETGEVYELNPAVRRKVRFRAWNLLQEDGAPESGSYDFVFCRNLLMYFHRATRNRACETLRRLLSPDGVLFVGPAEVPLAMENGFIPMEIPMAFACQRSSSKRPGTTGLERRDDALEQQELPARVSSAALAGPVLRESSAPRSESPAPAAGDLESAQRLADAGEFEQATAICEAYLRQSGASAKAYYLLGLLHDARGNPQAMDCYRKTLYLEPDHAEALWQLAMLVEKNGDRAEAQVLRHRARRAPRNL